MLETTKTPSGRQCPEGITPRSHYRIGCYKGDLLRYKKRYNLSDPRVHHTQNKTSSGTLFRWICDVVRHEIDLDYHCLVDACCCKGFWTCSSMSRWALRSGGCYSWAIHYSWIIVNSLWFKRYSYSWVGDYFVVHIHKYCRTLIFNSI